MTPALSFYMLAAARAEPFISRRQPEPYPGAPARPSGEVIWIHVGSEEPAASAMALAARIGDERPTTGFVLTSDEPPAFGNDLAWLPRPADFPRAVGAFLSAWAPSACIWIGGPIWPVLAAKARQTGIPMLLANATDALAGGHRGVPARDLLGLFDGVAARGELDRKALERAARRPVEVTGRLQRSPRLFDHDEGERLRLAAALQSRPVWFAAAAAADEAEALRHAQGIGQGASHRLLLIVQPADADAGPFLERFTARRSAGGAPPPGAPVFVADVPGEEGLWYRLASVSFIGGTLSGPAARADPFAAAALGSAIVHGPAVAPYAAHFAALRAAEATRPVRDAEGLGRAVEELLAPDRTAALAHRAWAVVSDGAEATDHVADEIGRLLDEAG